MQKPLISIIIPHFENADGLEILLNSIFTDSRKYPEIGFEVLVIDDYSCEQTQKELIKLQSKYDFKLYHNNSVKSAGTCRNIGIDKSTGKWILFADSDDYFLSDFLKSVSKYFDSDYDIVFFPPISKVYETEIESNRHIDFQKLITAYKYNNEKLMLKIRWHSPWSKLIKKELITKNGIKFDSILAGNDIYFSLCTGLKANKIKIDENIIYCINRRQVSLITNTTYEHCFSRIKGYVNYNKLLYKNKLGKYKIPYIIILIKTLKFGFFHFLKAFCYILINYDNPFVNIPLILHKYLKSQKHKNSGKLLKSIIQSIIKL
ncbi:MAG: glycosyltransferase family 2 protein [Candidatus Riflebacteria bacterium]|nr:glycosyltransferase family 2 protein [Candidatus Riflebacteria bacterium]